MLGYRKRSFSLAHSLLQRLRADLEDLSALKELQVLLISEILRTEAKIREIKGELRKIEQEGSATFSSQSSRIINRIEGFRRRNYIWRCFGDAIAFLYMDKFALKHTLYNTENVNPRQDAGFLLGKEGLEDELAVLDSALEHNIPALLTDITNTIRHGDVCLMGESDPYLIEVKSSKKLNNRGKRQKRNLEALRTFYETDSGKGFRGFKELRRRAYTTPHRTYVNEINECIVEAKQKGYAVRNPESGLHYSVIAGEAPPMKEIIESLKLKSPPLVYFLNQAKSQRAWSPYTPFVLTIERQEDLWDFIQGRVIITVFMEIGALCQIAVSKGCKANYVRTDDEYPLHVELPEEGVMRISEHFLMRIGLEFVSPEWIVVSAVERIQVAFDEVKTERGETPPI